MKKLLATLMLIAGIVSSWAQPSKPLDLSVTLLELNNYQLVSQKGAANGYVPLDSNSLVPPSFIFPGFASAPNGAIWSKSGATFGVISNLSIQPSGITAASIAKLGQLTIPGIGTPIFGVGIELSTIPLTLYGGNNRVYVASGQTIGAADVTFNNFTWSINSLGNFDLNSGAIKGGLSMSNSSISNVSSVSSPSGLSINFTNNRIVSLISGKDIIFSGNNIGVQVPDIDTNALANPSTVDVAKTYALNKKTADLFYPQRNGANTWTFTQTFSNGIVVTPAIPISSGGTGATNASQARQNLGIVVGSTNGLQAWSPILANLSTNTPVNNNFMIGSGVGASAAWVSRTPSQVRAILGIQSGVDTQPYSDTLQYIVNTVTNNTFNQRYIFVGDQITRTLIARPANLARADLGLEINATNGVLGFSSYLRDIAILGVPQLNEFIVGTGSTWTKRSATQVRDIISAQPANVTLSNISDSSYVGDDNISLVGNITNGTWNASTISVSRGGTGATDASGARSNLGSTTIGDALFTAQNQVAARQALGLQVYNNTFTNSVNTVEIGSTISSVTLGWVISPTNATYQLRNITRLNQTNNITNNQSTLLLTNLGLTADATWTLTVGDGLGITNNTTTSVLFQNYMIWGRSTNTSLNNTNLQALHNSGGGAGRAFTTSRSRTISMSGTGQYFYIAYPQGFGAASFTVGGLPNSAWTPFTNSYTNASGYVTNYLIYRTDTLQFGSNVGITIQ